MWLRHATACVSFLPNVNSERSSVYSLQISCFRVQASGSQMDGQGSNDVFASLQRIFMELMTSDRKLYWPPERARNERSTGDFGVKP